MKVTMTLAAVFAGAFLTAQIGITATVRSVWMPLRF